MACFESAGADFEQEWCQQDEVVPADEDDLDVPPALAKFLQAASRGHSPEAAAKDHDPGLFGHRHITSPGRTSRFAAGAYSTRPAPITVTSAAGEVMTWAPLACLLGASLLGWCLGPRGVVPRRGLVAARRVLGTSRGARRSQSPSRHSGLSLRAARTASRRTARMHRRGRARRS